MSLGYQPRRIEAPEGDRIEQVIVQRPLDRILSFTGRTIHDVINDPLARNEIRRWFKTYKWVERAMEVSDLERQWNG